MPSKLVLNEEAFRSLPSQWALDPLSEVHGVFSNRDLTSAPGREQAKALACNVLGDY